MSLLLPTYLVTDLTHFIKANTVFRPFTPPSEIYLQIPKNPAPAPFLGKRLNQFSSRFFPLNLHWMGYFYKKNRALNVLLCPRKFMLK